MTATPVAPVVDVVDVTDLTRRVRQRSAGSACPPRSPFHAETGRPLTRRLGYDHQLLSGVPAEAVESFAGVGNPLRLARLHRGERVLVLGSGSGTDLFAAALCVGPTGRVVGRDGPGAQIAVAEHLRATYGFDNVELSHGPIESLPFADDSFDAVISNGIVNLSARKADVFAEAARVLRPGGRIVVSDIVAGEHLLEDVVVGDADPWAVCPGGVEQLDDYRAMITDAGFEVLFARRNDHAFVSERAAGAGSTWGVESVTILASCCW
jgi:arsenite methyltransferase